MSLNSVLLILIALAMTGAPAWAQGSDDCSTALPIVGFGPHDVDLNGTSFTNGQQPGCLSFRRDVWFEWQAPTSGLFSVAMCGAQDFYWSTVVWDGCGANVLACGDFNCRYDNNRVVFRAAAGTSYFVQISAHVQQLGSFTIDPFSPNPNDDCPSAAPISGYGDFNFDCIDATSGSTTAIGCGTIVNDIWMEWTAPFTRFTMMSILTTSPHGRLVVYEDNCAGQEIACGNYLATLGQLQFSFYAEAGKTYMLRLGNWLNLSPLQGTLRIESMQADHYAGNGHAYLQIPTRLTWDAARLAAESMRLHGEPGHLATIEDAGEGTHVGALVGLSMSWMGLYQDLADPSYSEPAGGWKWTTGEPLNYTQWQPPNRPDNFGGEDAGGIFQNGNWEDQWTLQGFSFIVEWDLDLRGTSFCDGVHVNSTGTSCILSGVRTQSTGSELRLEANDGPSGQFGYFLTGSGTQLPGINLGDGLLCLSTSPTDLLGRYNVIASPLNSIGMFDDNGVLQNLSGTSSAGSGYDVPLALPFAGSPTIQSGETWHFQLWYRDVGGTSNFSNGASVVF